MTTPLPREQFAVTENFAYLNHAAVGVLPRRTQQALREFISAHGSSGVIGVFAYERLMEEYRARIARFIGARADEIAILRSTSDGANMIAGGFRWKPGDEIVLPDNEFGANAYPWLRLRAHGVNVRLVPSAQERLTPDILKKYISKNTRVVTVSWVSFEDGYRHDLAALAEVAHAAGALFCVDAIQALGAFGVDVSASGIDALYAGGAKWLLALQGVSFLYLRADLIDRFELAFPGWRSVANIWDFLDFEQPFAADATRFEAGTPNFIGALSLTESIALIESSGTAAIAKHVLDLTDRLVEGLKQLDAEIASIRGPETSSGIVTFKIPETDPIELGKSLQQSGFVTTYRTNGIRVAPHGYNTAAEIDRLVAAIAVYRKESNATALRIARSG